MKKWKRQRKGSPGRDQGTACAGPRGLVGGWLEDSCGAVLRDEAEKDSWDYFLLGTVQQKQVKTF